MAEGMLRSVELFTGAGGLALGSAIAGFHHEAVIEMNRYACETILENQLAGHPLVADWRLHPIRVERFDYSSVPEGVDLVAGGPPCQPFSIGGKHQAHQDRRDMFPQAVRAVRELRPRAFVFENVKGLTRQSFKNYFEYIKLQLSYPEIARREREAWESHLTRLERYHTGGRHDGLWYRVVARLCNAANYGVPQRRERVFIVGFRCDQPQEWSFPEPTHSERSLLVSKREGGEYWERHGISKMNRLAPASPFMADFLVDTVETGRKPWVTVRDALSDLPDPRTPKARMVSNHVFQSGARTYPGHTGSPLDEPAKTLKAGDHGVPGGENMIRYPDGKVRYFTVREAARLQTFPDDYLFHGCWTEAMRQLGNAVPVKLASVIVGSVRDRVTEQHGRRHDARVF